MEHKGNFLNTTLGFPKLSHPQIRWYRGSTEQGLKKHDPSPSASMEADWNRPFSLSGYLLLKETLQKSMHRESYGNTWRDGPRPLKPTCYPFFFWLLVLSDAMIRLMLLPPRHPARCSTACSLHANLHITKQALVDTK
jgi:hypothetical protein